jgi:hypothetical protein
MPGDETDSSGWINESETPLVDAVRSRGLIGRNSGHHRQTRCPVSSDHPSTEPLIDYLSLAWIRELSREVSESETMRELSRRHQIGVTQVVTDTPEGDVTYHLQVGDGHAAFGAGGAEPEHVKMQQDWLTAVAVATGELNAQEAFVTGRILLFGDRESLMGAQEVFAALDGIFASVRSRTRYSRS